MHPNSTLIYRNTKKGQAVLTFSSSPKAVAAMNSFYGSLKMVSCVCHLSSTNVVLQITKDI